APPAAGSTCLKKALDIKGKGSKKKKKKLCKWNRIQQ
ncbi:hypothetical protein A2U01_0039369, partial [Trifolium medium]|nr:hypothetical protein [Trifolium medium]